MVRDNQHHAQKQHPKNIQSKPFATSSESFVVANDRCDVGTVQVVDPKLGSFQCNLSPEHQSVVIPPCKVLIVMAAW